VPAGGRTNACKLLSLVNVFQTRTKGKGVDRKTHLRRLRFIENFHPGRGRRARRGKKGTFKENAEGTALEGGNQ